MKKLKTFEEFKTNEGWGKNLAAGALMTAATLAGHAQSKSSSPSYQSLGTPEYVTQQSESEPKSKPKSLIELALDQMYSLRYQKIDTISKTKNQIYSDTKMFISEYWKSAKAVIQNDDKEGGVILINGAIKIYKFYYPYTFTMKFYFKDNKYKAVIDNIGIGEYKLGKSLTHSPIIGGEYPGFFKCNMSKNDWIELQKSFPIEMNKILLDYDEYLRKNSKENEF